VPGVARTSRPTATLTASPKGNTVTTSATTAPGRFDLDVRIVEAAPPGTVLLGDTDDGCDTLKDGDC
jgi:FxLD family lantipeptide